VSSGFPFVSLLLRWSGAVGAATYGPTRQYQSPVWFLELPPAKQLRHPDARERPFFYQSGQTMGSDAWTLWAAIVLGSVITSGGSARPYRLLGPRSRGFSSAWKEILLSIRSPTQHTAHVSPHGPQKQGKYGRQFPDPTASASTMAKFLVVWSWPGSEPDYRCGNGYGAKSASRRGEIRL